MDIGKIMDGLKENRVWADYENEAPGLKPCPFCGGEARLIIRNPLYGCSGATARYRRCHMNGPNASIHALIIKPNGSLCTPLLPESLERGINAAIDAWNSRSVDLSRLRNLRVEVST